MFHPLQLVGKINPLFPINIANTLKNNLFSFGGNFPLLPLALIGGVRSKHSKRIQYKHVLERNPNEGGIQYHGFVYFPRPGEKDPPYEPTKLLMVRRIRAMKKKPYWEIDLLRKFKIMDRRAIGIVKNSPDVNAQLYRIKHLIEIKPITFKHGIPDDPKYGFLKENGEVISYNLLESDKMALEEAEEQLNDLQKKSMDGPTLKHRLRQNWFDKY